VACVLRKGGRATFLDAVSHWQAFASPGYSGRRVHCGRAARV